MKIVQLDIANFRGIKRASLLFPDHAVLLGDNNTGKSTVLEAIDLVLGPDRLNRRPAVDEHDFYGGAYRLPLAASPDGTAAPAGMAPAPMIEITATIADLSPEQRAAFRDSLEWWKASVDTLYAESAPAGIDDTDVSAALRISFRGWYDSETDDFEGATYFTRSLEEGGEPAEFRKREKQKCGFLYLRSLRTGSRALSLEHGSLLDIILRLKEIRPQMWEKTIGGLSDFDVASDPDAGISGILESVNSALKKYVPKEWGVRPHLKVSSLTREHLRKVVTAFIATGEGTHAASFFRQGTGTLNMLVLALLSQIAEGKQNVIFAMEEPETAIPPYAQKRIVAEVRQLAAQAIFTSHSPYVLEEFGLDETMVLARTSDGTMTQAQIALPTSIKLKRYRHEFRTRFCEGLLARRIFITEGTTEWAAFPVAARRLAEVNPATYASLEALGLCTIDAGTESQICDLAKFYRELGKEVFACADKQDDAAKTAIEAEVTEFFMHGEKGMEDLVLKNTTDAALIRFAALVAWPPHLNKHLPITAANVRAALMDYFRAAKGSGGIADFLAQCSEAETPSWIRTTCQSLTERYRPAKTEAEAPAPTHA